MYRTIAACVVVVLLTASGCAGGDLGALAAEAMRADALPEFERRECGDGRGAYTARWTRELHRWQGPRGREVVVEVATAFREVCPDAPFEPDEDDDNTDQEIAP